MIPKVIHNCWFGIKKHPKEYREYISSWKSMMRLGGNYKYCKRTLGENKKEVFKYERILEEYLEYKRRVGTKEEHENESVYFVDAKGW